jgi:CheY-like chemotaxis protein
MPARVLIVEDEWIVAADLRTRVEQLGYQVLDVAYAGAEAITKALSLRPDLLLLDIQLRDDLTGIQVAEAVLERLDIPIIFVTAYADRETLQRAQHVGPSGYLLKPFEESELSTAMELALYKHQMEKRLREDQLSLVTGQAAEGIGFLGPDGLFVTANAAAEEILGVPPGGLAGRSLADFQRRRGPSTSDSERDDVPPRFPLTVLGPNASVRDILVATTPARDAEGKPQGTFVLLRDVTKLFASRLGACSRSERKAGEEVKLEIEGCPFVMMRRDAEHVLTELQIATAQIAATGLTSEQQHQMTVVDRSGEDLRRMLEEGFVHVRVTAHNKKKPPQQSPATVEKGESDAFG